MPPEGMTDEQFLDGLAERGHGAYELAFVKGFPWDERRCAEFGAKAAEREIWLSVHAPYFAVLTVQEEDKAIQCRAALEHTVKLGRELGSRVIVAHLGGTHGEDPEVLVERISRHLEWVGEKVGHLGVGVGLETAGKESAFGSLGDIAMLAKQFAFVRPVIDWAHVHAVSGGALTSVEAFASVIAFLRDNFAGWMLDPLHAQFTDNQFGDKGEIRHIAYGEGSLKVGPLVEAAHNAGLRMTMISEARDDESHDLIQADMIATQDQLVEAGEVGRSVASGLVDFPVEVRAVAEAGKFPIVGFDRRLTLSNIDKPFFSDGFTKGDLISYYASIAPVLVPHLLDRAIVMSRFPDGADGEFFYEKQAPGHQPDWMPLAPIHSTVRDGEIEFVTARDAESLMWLANMGCIEIHPWLSTVPNTDVPSYAIFDLDPAERATWDQVVSVAKLLKVALDQLGLVGYLKTSGATGLHIYVPLEPIYDFTRVRRLVERLGQLLTAANPDDITMEWDIPKRTGKVFVDANQNVAGKTIASVYSVRPRPGAPVSTPIRWEEIDDVNVDDFTIVTIWDRISRHGDLFAQVLKGGQTIEAAERELGLDET